MEVIRTYDVVQPPTAGEMAAKVAAFILSRIQQEQEPELITFTARAQRGDIGPVEQDIELTMRPMQILLPRAGGMVVKAETADDNTINMRLPADPEEPASFSMPSSI